MVSWLRMKTATKKGERQMKANKKLISSLVLAVTLVVAISVEKSFASQNSRAASNVGLLRAFKSKQVSLCIKELNRSQVKLMKSLGGGIAPILKIALNK